MKLSRAFFRSSQGTSAHCFAAFLAAATALSTSSAVLRGSGGFSSRVEGLIVFRVLAVPTSFPSMTLWKVVKSKGVLFEVLRAMAALFRLGVESSLELTSGLAIKGTIVRSQEFAMLDDMVSDNAQVQFQV